MKGFLVYYRPEDEGLEDIKIFTSYEKAKNYLFQLVGQGYVVRVLEDKEDFITQGYIGSDGDFYIPLYEKDFEEMGEYVQISLDYGYWALEGVEMEIE